MRALRVAVGTLLFVVGLPGTAAAAEPAVAVLSTTADYGAQASATNDPPHEAICRDVVLIESEPVPSSDAKSCEQSGTFNGQSAGATSDTAFTFTRTFQSSDPQDLKQLHLLADADANATWEEDTTASSSAGTQIELEFSVAGESVPITVTGNLTATTNALPESDSTAADFFLGGTAGTPFGASAGGEQPDTVPVSYQAILAPGTYHLDFSVGAQSARGNAEASPASSSADLDVTVTFGESSVNVSVDDVAQDEGNSAATPFVFTVSLSAPAPGPVGISYTTVADSATTPADFSAASGAVSFTAGQQAKQVTVNVKADRLREPNEVFRLVLSAPSGAALSDGIGRGTIRNDDECDNVIPPVGGGTVGGTAGVDHLCGGPGPDVINGLGSDDVLYGRGGADTIRGGAGDDKIYGGPGNDEDLEGGDGDDRLDGGDGQDGIGGGEGQDTLIGGDGADTGTGGPGEDTVRSGADSDFFIGGPGADTIEGEGGRDSLYGANGPDTIDGGPGGDELHGDDQHDEINGGDGPDQINGGDGPDQIDGGDGDDPISGGPGVDTLRGGSGADAVGGNADGDTINGGPGQDILVGHGGDDTINSGPGSGEHLIGADGDDRLIACNGNPDDVEGNAGSNDIARVNLGDSVTGVEHSNPC